MGARCGDAGGDQARGTPDRGIAGFPEPLESEFDLFSVGHAGTGVSWASAWDEFVALADHLAAPMTTSLGARGVVGALPCGQAGGGHGDDGRHCRLLHRRHGHPVEEDGQVPKDMKRAQTGTQGHQPAQIGPHDACGAFPIRGLLKTARRHGWRVRTLDLRNSGDTAGDKSRVVGYGAYEFY